jgi:NADH:ubiquinone oxidoreductase subunit C
VDTSDLIPRLEEAVPGAVLEVRPFGRGGEISIWVELRSIQKVAQMVKKDPDFSFDWLENLSVMEVDKALVLSYFLRSQEKGHTLYLRGSVLPPSPDAAVEILTVTKVWPMAKLMELEVTDLFGIKFFGNPIPGGGRFIMPKGWEGFPLRKNYVFPTEFLNIPHARPTGHTEPDDYGVVT